MIWWRRAFLVLGLCLFVAGAALAQSGVTAASESTASFNDTCTTGGQVSRVEMCARLDATQADNRRQAVLGAFVAGTGIAFAIVALSVPALPRIPRIVVAPVAVSLLFAGLILPITEEGLAPMGATARCPGTIHYGGFIVCSESIPPLPADLLQAEGIVAGGGALFGAGAILAFCSMPDFRRRSRTRPDSLVIKR